MYTKSNQKTAPYHHTAIDQKTTRAHTQSAPREPPATLPRAPVVDGGGPVPRQLQQRLAVFVRSDWLGFVCV